MFNDFQYQSTHTRLMALFPGLPGWAGTRRQNWSGFTEARDGEWQWHQLGHMQVCTSLQTHNHASTPPLSFLQAGCPSCRPTNSVKALKANISQMKKIYGKILKYFQLSNRGSFVRVVGKSCNLSLLMLFGSLILSFTWYFSSLLITLCISMYYSHLMLPLPSDR